MRYILLVLLNLPVILLAVTNLVTQYKMNKITKRRFKRQLALWLIILFVFIASFPTYNYISDKPIFDAHALSLFDVVQTTAIVYLFYIANDLRRKIEKNEKIVRDLHQELSIKLSKKN